ncbi:BON domain-containing protein [Cereibacter sediminicola]|uniref:BON domain-containing protein n=1 Tax=Cereibacter sediminicola TaxID=2584941 RepID=UPI0011AA8631|nr:BON domain-containing protein [Cereibacter sediminicola]
MAKAPHESPEEGDPKDPYATGDAARPGSATMADRESEPERDIEDTGRTDASGYDVDPPPDAVTRHSHDIGLSDEDAAHQGWREFDSTTEWEGDEPYPAEPATEDEEAAEEEALEDEDLSDDTGEAAPVADLAEAVTAVLEDDPGIDVTDLSIEVRGATVILRGSAGSAEDRERAAERAARVPGVRSVDNELSV